MVGKFKTVGLVGVLLMIGTPVFAQDMQLPLIGNLDLDPLHILSPAPAAPAAAPAAKPMMRHHAMRHHMMKKSKMKKSMMHKGMMKKKM